MTGPFFKLGRFIFVRWLLVLAMVIGLLYLEEDWRGAHEWAATKAEWEAKGESFDRAKFIPPPVPEEQNLAALPVFKFSPVEGLNGETYLELSALKKALREDPPATEIPDLGKWSRGELPDMAKIRAAIASAYASFFKEGKAPDSPLAQLDAIYPLLSELRTASASRPLYRVEMNYAIDPPTRRPIGSLTYAIRISKLLTLHAILALHEQKADVALADLRLNQQIFEGTRRDPSLVGGLVAIGTRSISNVAIFDGLAEHLWSDAQLAEIEAMLKPVDFLADYQFTMRSEALFALGTLDYLQRAGADSALKKNLLADDRDTVAVARYFPGGWWDMNKGQIADFDLHELTAVDPRARRVFPDIALEIKSQSERAGAKWDAFAPWNLFFSSATPGLPPAVEKFAEAQVSVDETRMACALERYRLAHGGYPAALEALVPACIEEIPHDIMNGEPYHYRLNADGTFLLYSVGWNQTDEGGKVVFKTGDPKTIDYENGDWVWPTAKN